MHDVFTWPVGRARQASERIRLPAAPLGPVIVYVIAAATGGVIAGLAIGGLGLAFRASSGVSADNILIALVPVAALAALLQLLGQVRPLPERRAQVPKRWLHWRHRTATAGAFGLVIGMGVMTYLLHAAAWILAVALFVVPNTGVAVALGAIYGFARGLPLLVTWFIDRSTWSRPRWERFGGSRSPMALALAPLAATTYIALLLVADAG